MVFAAKNGCGSNNLGAAGSVATPARLRGTTTGTAASAGANEEWCREGLPAEAAKLNWPQTFHEGAKGERMELTEEGALATRVSGVGYGTAFVGPLALQGGSAFFEVEIAEMEPKRSQTLAIGISSTKPGVMKGKEKARDLGEGIYVMGYDLPKVYANGNELAKIGTKQWRPLKELKVGDRVGLLVQRRTMELIVFVNGEKKASHSFATGPGQQRWPNEIWGVVDLHGNVKSAWLRGPAAARRQLQRNSTVLALAAALDLGSPDTTGARPQTGANEQPQEGQQPSACTDKQAEQFDEALTQPSDPQAPAVQQQPVPQQTSRRRASKGHAGSREPPKKRARAVSHPCGCSVHLVRHTGEVVHVPRQVGPFVLGRNAGTCNMVLESAKVPKMVSRKHAVVLSTDDAVILEDCKSINGTFVNGRRVVHETLRNGDRLILGTPSQCPPELQLTVALPGSS